MAELETSTAREQRIMDPELVHGILAKHSEEQGGLIAILEEIQNEYGFLPEAALRIVAESTGRPLTDIYGVARFYHCFSLKPRGKHIVSVCLGTACHVRGAPSIVEEFERQLRIRVDETTEDKEFTLKTVNCLGACALGPAAVIDGRYFSKLRRSKVKPLLEQASAGSDGVEIGKDVRIFPVDVSCPRCNHSLMDASFFIEGRPSIRVTVSFNHKHGWLRLASLYGRYNVYAEYEVPLSSVVEMFCPHCHAELTSSWQCPACAAPMVQMIVRGGGVVRICSRRGCGGSMSHMLDLV